MAEAPRRPPCRCGDVLREHPRRDRWPALFGAIICFALFYLSTAFALGYGTGTLHYDRRTFLGVLIAAIVALAVGIVAAGAWSDRASPRRVLVAGCLATIVLGAALAPMLGSGSLATIWLWLTLALFAMGFVYGPLGAWLPGLFPARVRYTGASLAFNVGGIMGGGLAPLAAQMLADHGGLRFVGAYLAIAAIVSLCALLMTPAPAAAEPGRHA